MDEKQTGRLRSRLEPQIRSEADAKRRQRSEASGNIEQGTPNDEAVDPNLFDRIVRTVEDDEPPRFRASRNAMGKDLQMRVDCRVESCVFI